MILLLILINIFNKYLHQLNDEIIIYDFSLSFLIIIVIL